MSNQQQCLNCRFWQMFDTTGKYPPEEVGFCRRYPPAVYEDELYNYKDGVITNFPITGSDDWCGEWQGK